VNRLTEANAQRLATALTSKHLRYPPASEIDPDVLRGIVLTTIADTELVLTGDVQLEDFEHGP
jgi:hypothetical protein